MTTTSRNILLRGEGYLKEGVAGAAITPGHFIKLTTTGKYVVHSVAGGKSQRLVALAPEWVGDNPTINTAYALDDQVLMVALESGSEIYALLAANAAAIVVGNLVECAADGTVRKLTELTALIAASGTSDGTVADVGAAFNQTTLNNNFQDIATQLNLLTAYASKNAIGVALENVDNSAVGATARLRIAII